jgi:hypothetical protein
VIFTKAADKVLNRILPKVDAAAGSCGCFIHHATCESRRVVYYYYRKVTDYYGQCTIWTAFCYSRRTQEPC